MMLSLAQFNLRCASARIIIFLSILAGMAGAGISWADAPPQTPPSTAPADSAPSDASTATFRAAIQQLSARDPTVRDAAREQLMGMSPSDLPVLRAAVQQMRPLPPGDAAALHDIVKHVYLAGENTDANSETGFMGIKMRSELESVYPDDDEIDPGEPVGVVVDTRLPGFAAYRSLRDGDVILAIAPEGSELQRVHTSDQIVATVAVLGAGQRVRVRVLRGGRHVETTITLDARPRDLDPKRADFDLYMRAQEQKAQAFWVARFAGVVDEGIS